MWDTNVQRANNFATEFESLVIFIKILILLWVSHIAQRLKTKKQNWYLKRKTQQRLKYDRITFDTCYANNSSTVRARFLLSTPAFAAYESQKNIFFQNLYFTRYCCQLNVGMGRFDYPGLLTHIHKTEHTLLRIIENIIINYRFLIGFKCLLICFSS